MIFPFPRRQRTHDERISFYLQGYRDCALAEGTLTHLRTHYPAARVLLLTDGDNDPAWLTLAQRFDAEYTAGERLYGARNGGAMIHRRLGLFLECPTEYLLKIDTDTRIDRPFTWWPRHGHCLYGSCSDNGFLQGGCILTPLRAARALFRSRILLSPVLRDPTAAWAPSLARPSVRARMDQTGLISEDRALWWACKQLQIPTAPHPEICSQWFEDTQNPDRVFAIVHPDKFLHVALPVIGQIGRGVHERMMRQYADAIAGREA